MSNCEDLMTWQDIIKDCPQGKENKDKIKSYLNKYVYPYMQYINNNVAGAGIEALVKIKDDSGTEKIIKYTEFDDNIDNFNYNISNENNFRIIYRQSKEGSSEILKDANGSYVNDIFSYLVFGESTKMQGKVKLRVKKANNVTKQDIDDAGLIYFSSTVNAAVAAS